MSAGTLSASDIAARLNLRRAGRDWRGACPACGYATTFVLSQRNGRALGWCASCQDSGAVTAALRGIDGKWTPPPRGQKPVALSAEGQVRAARLWAQGTPVAGTLAEIYLSARRIPEAVTSPALRFLAVCRHPSGAMLPAMLALIVDMSGAAQAVQRIYLAPDGRSKAAVEPAKATLGPMAGGAIRLHPMASEIIVAEGVETAASATRLIGISVAWAAVSCGNLARLTLPAEVRSIVIAADNDAPDKLGRRPGQDAAETAATRWRAEGRNVRIALPNSPGADFNDLIREVRHGRCY